MKKYTIELSEELSAFYEKIAQAASLPPEQVLSDALYKLAAELSLHALHRKNKTDPKKSAPME